MTNKIEIEFNDKDFKRISSFKKIYDTILEEEVDFQEYISIVIDIGIEQMLKDIIPQDEKVLWNTIMKINREYPELFSEFAVKILSKDTDVTQQVKEKMKERLSYIA